MQTRAYRQAPQGTGSQEKSQCDLARRILPFRVANQIVSLRERSDIRDYPLFVTATKFIVKCAFGFGTFDTSTTDRAG